MAEQLSGAQALSWYHQEVPIVGHVETYVPSRNPLQIAWNREMTNFKQLDVTSLLQQMEVTSLLEQMEETSLLQQMEETSNFKQDKVSSLLKQQAFLSK